MEIFKLYGSIFVNTDEAKKSISDTTKNAKELGKKFQATGKSISNVGKTITKGVGLVGGAVAGAVGGITALAKKSAETADHIDKMSQKIGISRRAYQELDYVLSQNGMDVDSLQGGMKKLVNTMQSAQEGSKSATDAFNKLNVSFQNSDGSLRKQEEVFFDTISALQSMENETERNALANDLFGRSASELTPLLNAGAGSMDELRQKAEDLGLVLSDDAIDAGVNYTDTMDTLQRSLGEVATELGTVVLPYIQEFAEYLIDNMPKIKEDASKVAEALGQISEKIMGVVEWFNSLSGTGKKTVVTLGALVAVLGPILMLVGSLITVFGKFFPVLMTGIPIVLKTIGAFAAANPVLAGIILVVWGLIAVGIQLYKNWDTIKAKAIELKNTISTQFSQIKESIVSKVQSAKEKVGEIVESMKGFFNFEWKIPKIKLPHFSIKPNGWKFSDLLEGVKPELGIEWYAKGAVLNKPTMVGMNGNNAMIAGEAGPEAIAPISTLQSYVANAVSANNAEMINACARMIDYQTNALVRAIATLQESGTVKLEDPYRFFTYVRDQARIFEKSTKMGAFEF